MIHRKDYAAALDVQQASNIAGVARSLYDVLCRIEPTDAHCVRVVEGSTGTKALHPIVKLYVAKLADMCGLQCEWPTLVCDHVYQIARDPLGKPDEVQP